MPPGLVWALAVLVTWGLYGFFAKLATKYLAPSTAMIYYAFASFVASLVILFAANIELDLNLKGVTFGVLTGIAALAGNYAFLKAVSEGRLIVVVPISSLYPVVTILLALLFLGEAITTKQIFGIGLALSAVIVLST